MNSWFKTWTRPSIQQPRWIKQIVDKHFKPILTFVTYGKDYWDTWEQVYKPEGSCETCKNYKKTRNICGNETCFYETKGKKDDNK